MSHTSYWAGVGGVEVTDQFHRVVVDAVRTGSVASFDAPSLEQLAAVLVKARIARGWTQRQLAEALGMAEQQIQRYEANDYRSTSLARLCDIANALGVTVAQHGELTSSAA